MAYTILVSSLSQKLSRELKCSTVHDPKNVSMSQRRVGSSNSCIVGDWGVGLSLVSYVQSADNLLNTVIFKN